jgi:protein subunit release factor A
MRSAVQNRNLALSALAARTGSIAAPSDTIRDYNFDRGILTDRRLDKCFSIGDLQPLFESLLLAE